MAFRNYKSKKRNYSGKRNYNSYRKQSKATRLTRLAYDLGQVQKGLMNPDSRIAHSYNTGKNSVAKEKKSLF